MGTKKVPTVLSLQAVIEKITAYTKPNGANAHKLLDALDADTLPGLAEVLEVLDEYQEMARDDYETVDEYSEARQDAWNTFLDALSDVEEEAEEEMEEEVEEPHTTPDGKDDEIVPLDSSASNKQADDNEDTQDTVAAVEDEEVRMVTYTYAPQDLDQFGTQHEANVGIYSNGGGPKTYRRVSTPLSEVGAQRRRYGMAMCNTHSEEEWKDVQDATWFKEHFVASVDDASSRIEQEAPTIAEVIQREVQEGLLVQVANPQPQPPMAILQEMRALAQADARAAGYSASPVIDEQSLASALPDAALSALVSHLEALRATAEALLAEIRTVTLTVQAAFPSSPRPPSSVVTRPLSIAGPASPRQAAVPKVLDPNRKLAWTQEEIADVQARVARGESKVAIGRLYNCHHVVVSMINAKKSA
mgnify:CR=1 FL=1